jgi:uncharacterized protein YpmS
MEKVNNINYWKIVAIVLLIIVALESFYMYYALNTVKDYGLKDAKCSNEICFNQKADSYIYYDSTKTCTCYLQGKEIYREVLK